MLAVLQGFTEFLPISSSGHLLLPAILFGWPDQGLHVDIAVHLGSLSAVLVFFRAEIVSMCVGVARSFSARAWNKEAALALNLAVASIPAGLIGFLLHGFVQAQARTVAVMASASILFALALWWADSRALARESRAELASLHLKGALFIGVAQALALIPGTSRSGVTLTAARLIGLSREAAAKFSFLLSIPIILASGGLLLTEIPGSGADLDWRLMLLATSVSALVAFATIHFFLKLLPRIGVLPFVIYRLVFGAALLLWLS